MLLFNFSIYIQPGEFKKGLNKDLDYSSMKLLSDHEVFVGYWKQNEDEYLDSFGTMVSAFATEKVRARGRVSRTLRHSTSTCADDRLTC